MSSPTEPSYPENLDIQHYERMKAAEKRQAALEVDLAVSVKTIKAQRLRIDGLYNVIEDAARQVAAGEFHEALQVLQVAAATRRKS